MTCTPRTVRARSFSLKQVLDEKWVCLFNSAESRARTFFLSLCLGFHCNIRADCVDKRILQIFRSSQLSFIIATATFFLVYVKAENISNDQLSLTKQTSAGVCSRPVRVCCVDQEESATGKKGVKRCVGRRHLNMHP